MDVGADREFGVQAASFAPDVLVLTHDDKDHVGAADAFFEGRSYRHRFRGTDLGAPEVWVPLDWLHVLQALAQLGYRKNERTAPGRDRQVKAAMPSQGPVDEDIDAIRDLLGTPKPRRSRSEPSVMVIGRTGDNRPGPPSDVPGPQKLSAEIARGAAASLGRELQVLDSRELGRYPRQLRGEAMRRISRAVEPVINSHRQVLSDNRRGTGPIAESWAGTDRQVATRVAESAVRIAGILLGAYVAGCRFRWFDVDQATMAESPCWPSEGLPYLVTIVNAVEVEPPPPPAADPALALTLATRLSVQNRRALVTYLWPTMPSPKSPWPHTNRTDGVLIWSDAEAVVAGNAPTAGLVPWKTISLMSAPHHASAVSAHEAIWLHRPPNVKVMLSSNNQRDSKHFLAIPSQLRDCTRCGAKRYDSPVGAESRSWPATDGIELDGQCARTHRAH
ncbi:hypothetical protein [Kribbella sp. NPDC051620]|uniref:hypothetical protein n=1 Tax=Kribbella sp. NPDC051620 TaxID=3364120 RepID=UPI00379A9EB8